MKKFLTIKEVKELVGDMKFAQQCGGLSSNSLFKSIGKYGINVYFLKEKNLSGRYYYFFKFLIENLEKNDGRNFEKTYSLDEIKLLVKEANEVITSFLEAE